MECVNLSIFGRMMIATRQGDTNELRRCYFMVRNDPAINEEFFREYEKKTEDERDEIMNAIDNLN